MTCKVLKLNINPLELLKAYKINPKFKKLMQSFQLKYKPQRRFIKGSKLTTNLKKDTVA
jgi:hypothetical protein